jgi:hypothetical protein
MVRIIHLGEDSCHCLKVLAGAGHALVRCITIDDMQVSLRLPDRPDALVISGECRIASRIAAVLDAADLPLPVIVFAGTDERCAESEFDLVIPPLTPPSDWLSTIEAAIAQFQIRRGLGGESRLAGHVALL